jgi:aspartate racemase
MESGVYTDALRQAGTAVVTPEPEQRLRLHQLYMGELAYGRFEEATRTEFVDAITRLQREQGVDGVLLAGTELSLLLPEQDLDGLPLFDTTQIHVDRALAEMEKRV